MNNLIRPMLWGYSLLTLTVTGVVIAMWIFGGMDFGQIREHFYYTTFLTSCGLVLGLGVVEAVIANSE